MTNMMRLPNWVNPPVLPSTQNRGQTPRATLNRTAHNEQRFAIAGLGATIPEAYGRVQIVPRIPLTVLYNNKLLCLCVWGAGEWDAIETVYAGKAVITDVTHYLGTSGQVADPDLVAAISGYADDLPNIVYSVVKLSPEEVTTNIYATCRARQIYDPRSTLTVYSNNPSLALADYIVRAKGLTMDWSSVTTCANANDELLGDASKRREISVVMDKRVDEDDMLDTLREYAGVYVIWDDPVQLVPMRPRAVDHALTDSDIKSIKISKRGLSNLPNMVTIYYTDTTGVKWRQVPVSTPAIPGEEIREQKIRMPGLQSNGAAYRLGMERRNTFLVTDLDVELETYDQGIKITVGDRIDVTHAYGLTNKPLRVLEAAAISAGRWRLVCVEYDPAVYEDSIPVGPTFPDTLLPDPYTIPDGPTPVLAEQVYQQQGGNWSSRLRITWGAVASYPYDFEYRVRVTDGANLIWSAKTNDLEYVTGAIQEGVDYVVYIDIIGAGGLIGNAGSDSITAQGKYLVPGDVPFISVVEIGGETRIQIDPAVDIDIRWYEYRYGELGGSWETSTLIDRLDALRAKGNLPPGTWLVYAKAIDSVEKYSANAISAQVTVTLDAGAFLQGESNLGYDAGESSNIADAGNGYVTAMAGDTWDALFPGLMDIYTNPLLSYHSAGTSEWVSDALDLTAVANGTWQAQVWAAALSGTYTVTLEISDDTSAWAQYSQLSINAQGRYGRVRITATGSSTLFVSQPYAHIRCDVIPREERGVATTNASGFATVTLSGVYSKFVEIRPQTIGTAPRSVNYDNVQTGNPTTFDLYLFDGSNNPVADDVPWTAKVL